MDGGRRILSTPFNPRKDTKSSNDHLLFDEFQYVDENTVGDDGGDDVAVTQGVIPGGVVCVHDHTHDLRGQHRQHHGDVKLHPYLGHPSVYKWNINIEVDLNTVKLHLVMRFNIKLCTKIFAIRL